MRQLILTSIVVSVFGIAAFAQAPAITDVLDGAGYTATIAQGSIFVVKGTNLAATAACPSSCPPYPTTLGGATVTFTPVAGGTAIQTAIFATIPTQINAVLPATTAAGNYNVTVANSGGTSAPFQVTVVVRKFGLITVPGSGAGRAVVEEITASGQYEINRYTTGQLTWLGTTYTYAPAIPGQFMVAYGTGLNGATASTVTVVVGNMQITPTFAGPQGQYPGFDQINFQLPAPVETGCNVPFQVLIAGQLSNSTTISIAPAGASACVSNGVNQQTLTTLDQGGTIVTGEFLLTSQNTTATVAGSTVSARSESASGGFGQITADNLGDIATFTAAPGSCQVYHRIGAAQALLFPDVTFVDAGAITLSGTNISSALALKEDSKNFYTLNLGTSVTLPSGVTLPPGSGFTTSPVIPSSGGTYTLTGAGGTGVKSFTANTKVDSALTLTSPTALPTNVVRSSNLTLAWSGGDSDVVQVTGASGGLRADSTAANPTYNSVVFVCTTTADKGSITIPSSVLGQLPSTAANGVGVLMVTQTGVPATNNGLFATSTVSGQTVPGTYLGTIGYSANTTYQ